MHVCAVASHLQAASHLPTTHWYAAVSIAPQPLPAVVVHVQKHVRSLPHLLPHVVPSLWQLLLYAANSAAHCVSMHVVQLDELSA